MMTIFRLSSLLTLTLSLVLLLPTPVGAQATFGDDMPSGEDGEQRKPEDENQKIREKAGADDEAGFAASRRPTSPEELYAEADRLLKRGYYTKAQEYLERIRIRFPFSQYATLADLKIGEVYMKKGEYALAVNAFRDFRKLHPNHPETHYVVYMMAQAELKQAPKWAPRDQAATERALEILDGAPPPQVREGARFEDKYPDSEWIDEVQVVRKDARDRLALKIYDIGRFYQKRSRYSVGEKKTSALRAAAKRYEDVQRLYPDTQIVPRAELMRVRCLMELGELDAALQTLNTLRTDHPDSREAAQAAKLVGKQSGGATAGGTAQSAGAAPSR